MLGHVVSGPLRVGTTQMNNVLHRMLTSSLAPVPPALPELSSFMSSPSAFMPPAIPLPGVPGVDTNHLISVPISLATTGLAHALGAYERASFNMQNLVQQQIDQWRAVQGQIEANLVKNGEALLDHAIIAKSVLQKKFFPNGTFVLVVPMNGMRIHVKPTAAEPDEEVVDNTEATTVTPVEESSAANGESAGHEVNTTTEAATREEKPEEEKPEIVKEEKSETTKHEDSFFESFGSLWGGGSSEGHDESQQPEEKKPETAQPEVVGPTEPPTVLTTTTTTMTAPQVTSSSTTQEDNVVVQYREPEIEANNTSEDLPEVITLPTVIDHDDQLVLNFIEPEMNNTEESTSTTKEENQFVVMEVKPESFEYQVNEMSVTTVAASSDQVATTTTPSLINSTDGATEAWQQHVTEAPEVAITTTTYSVDNAQVIAASAPNDSTQEVDNSPTTEAVHIASPPQPVLSVDALPQSEPESPRPSPMSVPLETRKSPLRQIMLKVVNNADSVIDDDEDTMLV